MRDFVVYALAVYYVTYVVTRSAFPPMRWLRDRTLARFGEKTTPAYLVTCPWCIGFWVALVSVGVAELTLDSVPMPGFVVLAGAAVAGGLQMVFDLVERGEELLTPRPPIETEPEPPQAAAEPEEPDPPRAGLPVQPRPRKQRRKR